MRGLIRRIPSLLVVSLVALWPVLTAPRAAAQTEPAEQEVLIATMDDATLQDLLATPGFLALAQQGGAALVVRATPGGAPVDVSGAIFGSDGSLPDGVAVVDLGPMANASGAASAEELDAAAERLATALERSTATNELVLVVSNASPAAVRAAGDHLGALVMAEGSPQELADDVRAGATAAPARTLTSDSTRRVGVVSGADLLQTAFEFAGLQSDGAAGAPIRAVDAPPPVDLRERYLESKRLSVPIGTAAAIFAGVASLLAIVGLSRRGSPPWLRRLGAWLVISIPFLALSLLLVGHLPSLTYATVVPSVIATTAIGTVAMMPVARRWGTLNAIAFAGVILLAGLAVEAALGWSAALTPLLGGSQLDGGRFFGLPNAYIGLLVGGSVYVAQRLPRAPGTALIAVAGLFAGSPWTGSNIGAAVTLFAAAGIWWGLRGGLDVWRTALASAVAVAGGTILVVVAHRYLTSAATHITRFSEHTGGPAGVWDTIVHRLGVGTDLLTDNPFALVPVIGVVVMLVVVLRPPGPVRASFDEAPVWRLALLTIVVSSVVAYLVNDSGAAAIGEGLTTSLAGMLYVSLRWRDGMMMAS